MLSTCNQLTKLAQTHIESRKVREAGYPERLEAVDEGADTVVRTARE